MAKPKLVLVHGMGQHTANSFKNDFNEACKMAFNLYPSFSGKSAKDYVDLVSVEYNDIFDEYREKMAERSKPVLERLRAIPNMSGDLTSIASEITKIEANIDDDDFFKTHWLDVIFYRFTPLGEYVRIRVGKEIARTIGSLNGGAYRVHVLGHSLGCAVLHDSLAKLYDDNYTLGDEENLSTRMHKLGSLHMVANTSRVLESFVPVNKSVVKPGPGGCTAKYYEYRHSLDPITWPKPFNPTDNGGWISNDSWFFKRYQLIRPTSITSEHGNTHSIGHYIFDPKVHLKIFKKIFGLAPTKKQISEGHENFIDQTLARVANDLEESLGRLRTIDIESIKGLLESANALKTFIGGAI